MRPPEPEGMDAPLLLRSLWARYLQETGGRDGREKEMLWLLHDDCYHAFCADALIAAIAFRHPTVSIVCDEAWVPVPVSVWERALARLAAWGQSVRVVEVPREVEASRPAGRGDEVAHAD